MLCVSTGCACSTYTQQPPTTTDFTPPRTLHAVMITASLTVMAALAGDRHGGWLVVLLGWSTGSGTEGTCREENGSLYILPSTTTTTTEISSGARRRTLGR
jgi:hypothetical protein